MTVRYEVGDTREVVARIPDGSVSLVASSPPFIALRSYLPADHPDKHREIGSEPDPASFLDTLLGLTAEWGRVLAPWGSIAIELGDTYSGGGGEVASREHRPERDGTGADGGARVVPIKACASWPRAKSLALIPQLYATSLAYGRNLLTGHPSPAGQWLVRNVIVWHRPNPAVGALGDKVRPSTSYITVATRSAKRWFDLDAVRGDPSPNTHARLAKGRDVAERRGKSADRDGNFATMPELAATAGAPPLDCWFDQHDTWTMTTQPSSLAHYAMWPAKLAERLILMMCPAEVCTVCGEPRRRIVKAVRTVTNPQRASNAARSSDPGFGNEGHSTYTTLGWSDCGHDTFAPGTVLDPFAGTGTTLAVADLHGRNAIGIDLDDRNRDLYPARRDEVHRALNPTHVDTLPGQQDLFGEAS